MRNFPVVSIFGPTAVGKTAVGVEVRARLEQSGVPVTGISADAYAVYREIPIITGAPSAEDGSWLTVASRSVSQEWSAGAFASEAQPCIDSASESGGLALLVGGTGLYLQAALASLDLRPPVPEEIRREVQEALAAAGNSGLHAQLKAQEPEAAAQIDPNDTQRLTRALEAALAGQPQSQTGDMWDASFRHPTLLFGITMDRKLLRERISNRVDQMLVDGAVAEVERAWALNPSRTAQAAIGMKELRAGDVDSMKVRTHRFAKRQETWMRKLTTAHIIDATSRSPSSIADEILGVINSRSDA